MDRSEDAEKYAAGLPVMAADLPTEITVNAAGTMVQLRQDSGLEARSLPVANTYGGSPGCYVAVYSHRPAGGVYRVASDIWVHGLIRVQGVYDDAGIAQPTGYEGQDISASDAFKRLAAEAFPAVAGDGWVGGDTGGFLGRLLPG